MAFRKSEILEADWSEAFQSVKAQGQRYQSFVLKNGQMFPKKVYELMFFVRYNRF